jgi:hypothetical protein
MKLKTLLIILTLIFALQTVFAQKKDDLATAKANLNKATAFQQMAQVEMEFAAYYLGKSPNFQLFINNSIKKLNARLLKEPKNAPFLLARSNAYRIAAEYANSKNEFGKNKLNDAKIKNNLALASKDIEAALKNDKSLADYYYTRGKIRVFQCKIKVYTSESDCYDSPLSDFNNAIFSAAESYTFFDDRIELYKTFGKDDLAQKDEKLKAIIQPLVEKTYELQKQIEEKETAQNLYELASVQYEIFDFKINKISIEDIKDDSIRFNYMLDEETLLLNALENVTKSINGSSKSENYALRGKLFLFLGSLYEDASNKTLALEKYNLAVTDYTQAIKLDPKSPLLYWERGVVYGNLGKEDLKKADVEMFNKLK